MRQDEAKHLNRVEWRVLRSIFANRKATRAVIARESQLSLVKTSAVLGSLEEKRCIRQKGKIQSGGGRPSRIYTLNPELFSSVGISVKPDTLRLVALDSAKEVLDEQKCDLELSADPTRHVQDIVGQLSAALDDFLRTRFSARERPVAAGIALPGLVDPHQNVWLHGMQMTGIDHINIGQELRDRFQIPIYIDDIARAITCLEQLLGQGHGIENFVLLYLDVGMGAGIVIDNRLYRGYHGLAGEIGHIVPANNSYRCSCNNVGCLETVLSIPGIQRLFRDRLDAGVRSILQTCRSGDGWHLTPEQILAAARQGDRFARTTLYEIGAFLGAACSIVIKLYNPQRIIIGGRVASFRDYLLESMNQAIRQQVLHEMLESFEVSFSEYAPHQEAYGAALLAMDHYLK